MRSPFKYTLNVVCPITESLAGAHTYVTNSMKAGSGGGFQNQLWRNRYRNCYIWRYSNTRSLHWILDSVNLDRLVGAIVPQHLLELE
jgi:hypothetical protein